MSNGKAKGSNFEREIAKSLSIWINGAEKPYVFWRSPSSGSLATIAESMDASGDLIALRPEGRFLTDRYSIEMKTGYPDADFHKHFKNNKNNIIEDFWKQCTRDAIKAKKWAMLIFRKKGYQPIIGVEKASISSTKISITASLTLCFECDLPEIIFYDFKKFVEAVTPEIIEHVSLHRGMNET